jgi:hypothetical protein
MSASQSALLRGGARRIWQNRRKLTNDEHSCLGRCCIDDCFTRDCLGSTAAGLSVAKPKPGCTKHRLSLLLLASEEADGCRHRAPAAKTVAHKIDQLCIRRRPRHVGTALAGERRSCRRCKRRCKRKHGCQSNYGVGGFWHERSVGTLRHRGRRRRGQAPALTATRAADDDVLASIWRLHAKPRLWRALSFNESFC